MLVALHTKVSSQPETRFPRCTKPIYQHPFSRGLGLTQPLNSEKGLLITTFNLLQLFRFLINYKTETWVKIVTIF